MSHTEDIQYLTLSEPFELEAGGVIHDLRIAYHTYGTLNETKNNVKWVFQALTASSQVSDWWPGSFGEDKILNDQEDYVVCSNLIGSCYGSTSPLDQNPQSQKTYFLDFPLVTVRDQVRAFQLLKNHLGIESIHIGIGGSMGACHALEWAIMEPTLFESLYLSVCSAKESSWGKAIHTAHRMAIEADPTWGDPDENGGINGLKAARAIGMVIYRNYLCYEETQPDDQDTLTEFKAGSYQRYQGQKLADRFNAYSYYRLLDSLDTHNVGRDRGGVETALKMITAKTVIVNIDTDLLYPEEEQKILADHIPNGIFESISSIYGHDGFLVETEKLTALYQKHFSK